MAPKTKRLHVRAEGDLLARLDALAPYLAEEGIKLSTSEVARAVLAAGLEVLETKHGIKKGGKKR